MAHNKVYKEIAGKIMAIKNCQKTGNKIWESNHIVALNEIVDSYLPHGSGFDCGCAVDLESSNPDRIIITFDYHHMKESGMYSHWEDYKVIITPSLYNDFNIRITGKDYSGFKDYAFEVFYTALNEIVE